MAVDEFIDLAGRSTLEAVLEMSAMEDSGHKNADRRDGEIRRHGRQAGIVPLSDRKIRVAKPRLRRRCSGRGGEVEIPVYKAMRSNKRLSVRVLEILMRGVSTNNYKATVLEMAETVSVSKSAVNRMLLSLS